MSDAYTNVWYIVDDRDRSMRVLGKTIEDAIDAYERNFQGNILQIKQENNVWL